MANRFSVEAVFKVTDMVTAPIRKMQRSVGKFTGDIHRGMKRVERVTDRVAANLKRSALIAAGGLTTVGFAIKDIVTLGADFDRALGNAAVKFRAMGTDMERTGENYKRLRKTAIDVGRTTEFTATQAANGLNFLARAGFDAETSMGGLPNMVDFSLANEMTDLARATDIVSDTMGAFNMISGTSEEKISNLNRVSRAMTVITNRTNTNVEQLFESVKKGGPIFAAAGFDIEKYAAMVGFAAQAGIKGGESGIAMKNITLALAGVGNQAAKTLKRLGIAMTLKDSNGNDVLRDPLDTLDELRLKLSKMGTGTVPPLLAAIFGKIPIATASNMVTEMSTVMRDYEKAIRSAPDDFVSRNAKFIADDTMGSIKSMLSAFESFKLKIFEGSKGGFIEVFDRITEFFRSDKAVEIADKIADAILKIIDNLPEIFKWFKRIGVGVAVFITLTAVLKTLVGVLTLINLLMAANPITLIVIGVTALVAAFIMAVAWADKFSDKIGKMPVVLRVLLLPIASLISSVRLLWDIVNGKGLKSSFSDFDERRRKLIFGASGNSTASNASSNVASNSTNTSAAISKAEVTLRAEQGTSAQMTDGDLGDSINLIDSGGFSDIAGAAL